MAKDGNRCEMSSPLEALMTTLNGSIADMQALIPLRGVPAEAHASLLQSMDVTMKQIELQLKTIEAHLKAETEALPKARAMTDLAAKQQKKLLHMFENLPPNLRGVDAIPNQSLCSFTGPAMSNYSPLVPAGARIPKEKKGKGPPPRRYVTEEELASLSSYMRGRVNLEKVNAAIDEMVVLAEANSQLVSAPRKKLGEDVIEKVLELRDIASSDSVKGKHFFLESDMRGPVLRMDTTERPS
ncbi:hypothetical protein O6H91_Y089400 [Diphasiastrum complanatum]|nr:hypothetical protein O6H91_Y089400 [Diphasiastrum complanatum]